jgi:S-adenosylmethionine decarboxylase proenzyme
MQGLHLCADLRGCPAELPLMRSTEALRQLCIDAVREAGLQAVADCFHAFQPAGSGITGVVLLAESHLAIHTWPEQGAVTLDVYVCNFGADNRAKAQALLAQLQVAFAPAQATVQAVERGGS